ncbi:GntR family transcriptional regulator [Gordonia spumicola]|uniref:GntR family transcriptional regulator n=1 Tax=Gordonia spumicola TaxID=589161 RepID=A0A7I9V4A5_9ACTN|nr:FadR/GntR family transcriptional regulator [Gordonia spumicola]GED99830.1 GntR family transcriptional regulator [Gordonia spumicola]
MTAKTNRAPVSTGAGAEFTAVRRVSPTQQVRKQLLEAIETGEFAPGAALPSERELCESFGVSRVSVREALAGLEAMNLISIQHGRGAFVRESVHKQYMAPFSKYLEIHHAEMIEMIKVRGALDELAAQEVAVAGRPEAIESIREAAREFEAAAESGDYRAAADSDRDFHLRIADSVDGELLPKLIHMSNSVLLDSRVATFSHEGQLSQSVDEHRAIVEAIAAGDVPAARAAVNAHMARILLWLETFVPDDAT